MRLRKTRTHETGSSNLDYKAEKFERPDEARIEFLATAKSKNFFDIVATKIHKTAPQPLKETQTFYVENQIDEKEKYPVGYPREAWLEEQQLRKRVFTGDSNTQYDNKKPPRVTRANTKIDKKGQLNKLIAQKHDQHATAIAETQLVGFEQFNKLTLEGRVDLEKVKEIRRAIRRRYANRKNFQKIFNAWDDDSTGAITPKNAFEMIQNMGININFDEARVLVASVDIDKSGDLSLNEFMDLIFNSTDALNVNLKELPLLSDDSEHNLQRANNLMSKLHEDEFASRRTKHVNQLSVILKNKLSSLKTYIFAADSLQQGFVSHEKFFEIIKKLAIPENIMSQQDIQNVFNNHKIDEHKFNYKLFIDFLRDYEFVPEDIYRDPAETEKKKNDKQKYLTAFNYEEDKKIHVFDANEINSWHLEQIREKSRKVFRIIGRYLDSKESFDTFLMQQMKITDQSEFAKQHISKQLLTKAIENLFLNVGDKDVKKDEVESFLSIFSYNNHNTIQAAHISKAIYEETDGEWFKRIQWKLKRPPPPPENMREKEAEDDAKGSQSDFKVVEPGEENYEQFFDTHFKPESMDLRQYKGLTRTSSAPHFPSSLNRLLTKFENRVFCGSQKAYDIFKKFDVDQDGYISRKDIAGKIREMNILDENEIKPFLLYMDPTNKGYVDFNEFSTKVRWGMTVNDEMGIQTVIPFTAPSSQHHKETYKILPFIKERVADLRRPYYPPETAKKNTRFGASPMFQNTFTNFRVSTASPMFSTAAEQFEQSHNHRIEFQKNEFERKKGYEEGRIQRRKEHMNIISQKIENENIKNDLKEENKCKAKGMAQWTYEHDSAKRLASTMLMSSTFARSATRVLKNTLKTTQWNIQARQSKAYSLFQVPVCMFSGQNKNFVMKQTELSNELLISLSMGFEHNQATNQVELTKNMIANNVLKSSVVQRAFQELDRGLFAVNHKQKVYANNPLSIGKGQNMTSPLMHGLALEEFHEHIVTIMKHKLQKQETLRILDVGCGRGYISFALGKILDQNSHLDKVKVHIKGIDIHEELIQGAKDIKNKLQYHHNIDFEFKTNNIESEINEAKHKYDLIYVGVALDQNVYAHLIEKLYSSKQEGSCVLCPVIQEDLEQNLVLREGSQERVVMKCVFSQMVTQKQEEVSKYFLQDGEFSEEDKGGEAAQKDEENKVNVTNTKMHQDLVKFETHLKLLEAKLKRFYEEHKQKHGHNPGLKDLHSNEESKKLIENIQQVKKDIRFTHAKIKESQQ